MADTKLWDTLKELKSPKYKWVDLTHELSPDTPHWYGFKPLQADLLFDYEPDTPDSMKAHMRCFQYSFASQYGTHTDVPRHFWGNGRAMHEITVQELVYPLVVIDKSAECAANPDFMLKTADLESWEAEHGRIPEGAYPYPGEQYILEVDRIQVEVMRNLHQVPPVGSLIVLAFPKLKDGVGFSTRCFAICPTE